LVRTKPVYVYPLFKKCFLLCSLVLLGLCSNAQLTNPDSSITPSLVVKNHADKKRIAIVTATNVSLWTASFIALNKTWYANYPRSSFHFFNDNAEWNQMDKAGHLWTDYHITRLSYEMWKWTGLNDNKAVVLGGISGVAYQTIIEIQDGFSSQWGFSWGDMTANVTGAAAFVAQQLAWKEQRIQVKLSYWPKDYPADLLTRRNQLFGTGWNERILKDYNSQTYWASANIRSFFPTSSIPKWLNISLGYGADGMYGGTQNIWTDKDGNSFNRTDIQRVRRFYLSLDADLTKIKTKSGLLQTVFYVLNMVKLPAPALEVNSMGEIKLHGLKFL
jgi:hypothetical protein